MLYYIILKFFKWINKMVLECNLLNVNFIVDGVFWDYWVEVYKIDSI